MAFPCQANHQQGRRWGFQQLRKLAKHYICPPLTMLVTAITGRETRYKQLTSVSRERIIELYAPP